MEGFAIVNSFVLLVRDMINQCGDIMANKLRRYKPQLRGIYFSFPANKIDDNGQSMVIKMSIHYTLNLITFFYVEND